MIKVIRVEARQKVYSLIRLKDNKKLLAYYEESEFINEFNNFLNRISKNLKTETAYKLKHAYSINCIKGIKSLVKEIGMKVTSRTLHEGDIIAIKEKEQ